MNIGLNLRDYTVNTARAWMGEWRNTAFRVEALLMPGLYFVYSAITQRLGNYIETRKGIHLEDKLLSFFPSFDFSTSIFILLYTSLALLIVTHLDKPKVILRLVEMHFLVAVVRQVCILIIALEPPTGIIVLRDIFLENTVYPHAPLTKDLFFSGHVASVWIYYLCAQTRFLKRFMIVATILMSFMVLSMRIHYTYDVYGALFFTSLIYIVPSWIRNYYGRTREQLS